MNKFNKGDLVLVVDTENIKKRILCMIISNDIGQDIASDEYYMAYNIVGGYKFVTVKDFMSNDLTFTENMIHYGGWLESKNASGWFNWIWWGVLRLYEGR